VFLDRDGTVIVDKVHLTDPADVELLPGAGEAIRMLNEAGLPAIIVSNQAVVARGLATVDMVEAAMARTQELLEVEGARIDCFYFCPHHPDFTGECDCRKPAPGMLLRAAQENDIDLDASYMVGDWWADIGAGRAVGATTVLVPAGESARDAEAVLGERGLAPDRRAADLLAAVCWIIEQVATGA
jgi:D-glycero-D-manno-heptose 1,7-bisphosphate phosphatase